MDRDDLLPAGRKLKRCLPQWRMDLEAFELVLLRRPENPPDYDDAELERIQREHLAHHARLRASGQVVTNGPVVEPPDPSLRGLTFYRTGSLAEARQLAEADPAVRAGRLTVQIMTWYCPPGTMGKPGRAVTV
jgi:uncharacterized protein YciI